MGPNGRPLRLLPWSSPDGKPCYVVGDGTGPISLIADRVESVQLEAASELLAHADDLLADEKATVDQLRYLATCMAEALRNVHRIAESRGARLPVPDVDDPEDEDNEGGLEYLDDPAENSNPGSTSEFAATTSPGHGPPLATRARA